MADRRVLAETTVLHMAGIDTNSQMMSWILHLIMLHPHIYTQLVDEVRSAFGEGQVVTHSEGRTRLPYLEASIYEGLRLAGAGRGLMPRTVPEGGVIIHGHYLPAETLVYINIAGVNYNRDIWDEPFRFNPERFLNNKRAKYTILTFSAGVRICPGRNLAWAEIVTVLANTLKDYDLELSKGSPYSPDVLDNNGYPRHMDPRHFLISSKTDQEACKIIIKNRRM